MNLQNENLRLTNIFSFFFENVSPFVVHIIQVCECVTPQCFTALKTKTYIYLQRKNWLPPEQHQAKRQVRRIGWGGGKNPRFVLFWGNCCCCLLSADHYFIFHRSCYCFMLMNPIIILIINLLFAVIQYDNRLQLN